MPETAIYPDGLPGQPVITSGPGSVQAGPVAVAGGPAGPAVEPEPEAG